jgi:hypothetical protein
MLDLFSKIVRENSEKHWIYILLLCLLVELKIKTRNMRSKMVLSFTKHNKKLA